MYYFTSNEWMHQILTKRIINVVCFINSNSNIYQHNDIYSKIIGASQYFS